MRTVSVKKIDPPNLVNCGSSLLNLACTDSVEGAFPLGSIITIPGRTDSGKTILALTCLACCANDSRFNDYKLIYDDVESKMKINIPYVFNKNTENRIQKPLYGTSSSIQNFETNICRAVESPCIYILDTPDALTTDEEMEKIHKKMLKMVKNPEEIKQISGSYHMEKAKMLHQTLREINDRIEKNRSLLIMLQQVRDKMGIAFGRQEETAGGRAPAHYSALRIWMTPAGRIKSKDEKVGTKVIAQVEKNHFTGKLREATFSIYYDYGIDDIGSIVDWMISQEYWKKDGRDIYIEELGLKLSRSKLIQMVESEYLEDELKRIVQKHWNKREESLKLNRKRRF